MTRLFKRAVRLVAGSLAVEDLRVQFKARKNLSKEPNELEATIYNLSEASRSALQVKGARVVLEAGYGTETSQIFVGNTRLVSHAREGADWLTRLQCGDGEQAYRYAKTLESFAPGTPKSTVARRLLESMGGLDAREAIAAVSGLVEQFTQGFVSSGRVSTELTRVLKKSGLDWSIQDGKLQVLTERGATTESAVLLSADTGLVGSPVHGSPVARGKPQTLTIKSLLQPSIRPGRRVQLEAAAVQGLFRVQEVRHVGDTHGGDWYSEIEAIPL